MIGLSSLYIFVADVTSPTQCLNLHPIDIVANSQMAPLTERSKLTYDAVLLLSRLIAQTFFREVRPRGAFNIPRDGPIIFVAAPHSNQARIPFNLE